MWYSVSAKVITATACRCREKKRAALREIGLVIPVALCVIVTVFLAALTLDGIYVAEQAFST